MKSAATFSIRIAIRIEILLRCHCEGATPSQVQNLGGADPCPMDKS